MMTDRLRAIIEKGKSFFTRYYKYFPYLSLALGFVTVIFWERGFDFIRWGFIYLLAIAVTTFVAARFLPKYVENKKLLSRSVTAVEFINQNIYQDMLFFLLPVYWSSSTFLSLNFTFVILILALCVITTFDDIYRGLLLKNTYTRYLFFVFVVFAFMNFSLSALFGIKSIWSLYLSILISLIILTPVFANLKEGVKRHHALYIVIIGLLSILIMHVSKPYIPPVPLSIKEGTAAIDINRDAKEPVSPFKKIRETEVSEVYCYTRIFAPLGVKEKLWHIWKRDGYIVHKVPLTISGGRKEGFRTWSKKTLRKNESAGKWSVDVVTDGGQLVGRVKFRIVND